MPRRVYPVPEIILDDHIRIEGTESGDGSMDNESRLMRVPLLDSPACRHVRAHEMAHARHSPSKPTAPKGVHPMTIQRVEDMRMNVICRGQGLHEAMDAPIVDESLMWERLLTGEREILTAGISTYDTGDWPEFVRRSGASEEDQEFIASIADAMRADPSWTNTQRLSQSVEAYLRHEEEESGAGEGEGSDGEAGEDGEESGNSSESGEPGDGDPNGSGNGESDGEPVDLSGDLLDRMVDRKLETEAASAAKDPFEKGLEILENFERNYARGEAKVVPAKVTQRPMPKRLAPSKFKSRAKVPADQGMVPKHMNRYCTDKAIFAGRGRKRSQGGTILIDASSSMTLHSEQVDTLMDLAPLGTIATYSGSYSEENGDIWVIAKNGKRAVGQLTPPGPLNKVDVPALEWMLKQPGPYYWVCDGGVSGGRPHGRGSECFGTNIYAKCKELVERHHIIMVPNIEDLPDVMRKTL